MNNALLATKISTPGRNLNDKWLIGQMYNIRYNNEIFKKLGSIDSGKSSGNYNNYLQQQ